MDRFTRIHLLHQLLRDRRHPVPRTAIEHHLECSRATVQRCIRDLRDYLGAPLVYDPEHRGYYYDDGGDTYQLPGLWFTPAEIQALALLDRLLEGLAPGLLRSHLAPLAGRIERLLGRETETGTAELRRRLRLLPLGRRDVGDDTFAPVTEALLQRRRLHVRYRARGSGETSDRVISPQRLAHYRDNWYLDAWCHTRADLRVFALDRLTSLAVLDARAEDIPDDQLDAHFAAAYGIFAGRSAREARLRFTPRAARWVAEEQWHPDQRGHWRADGRYELVLPYGDPTELVMDILRHGPDCEVVAPLDLREQVADRLRQAASLYGSTGV